jgi:hypothetical protein
MPYKKIASGQKSLMKRAPRCANFTRMVRTTQRSGERMEKADKRVVAQQEFRKVLDNACVAGFHGSASVTVTVQDGHIQYTRVAVERMVR